VRLRKPKIAPSAVVWLVLGAIYFLVPLIATLLFSLKDAQTGKCCSLSAYGVILHDPQFWSTIKVSFRLALETPGQENQAKEFLVTQLMDAYLQGKDYSKATAFGAEMIGQAQQNQSRVGPAILLEVRNLVSHGAPDDALHLIELALKMDPPLADNYARQLRDLDAQVRAKAQQAAPAQPTAP